MTILDYILGIYKEKNVLQSASLVVDMARDQHDHATQEFLNKGAQRRLSLAETNGYALKRIIEGNKRP